MPGRLTWGISSGPCKLYGSSAQLTMDLHTDDHSFFIFMLPVGLVKLLTEACNVCIRRVSYFI